MKPSAPPPSKAYLLQRKAVANKGSSFNVRDCAPPKSTIGIGMEGGLTVPIPYDEGVFRALDHLKVPGVDGVPASLLSQIAFMSSESGSTPAVAAVAYADNEKDCHNKVTLKQLLQTERINTIPTDSDGVPEYTTKDSLDKIGPNTIVGASVKAQEGGAVGIFEGLAGTILKGVLPIALGGSHVVARWWRDKIQIPTLDDMGGDGFGSKRTASSSAVRQQIIRLENSCCNILRCRCLKESDFVVQREGTPTPLLNFSLYAPQEDAATYYAEVGKVASDVEVGKVAAEPLSFDRLQTIRGNHGNVTPAMFSASPDKVDTKYRASGVPAGHPPTGSWPSLPFGTQDRQGIESVQFNRGDFKLGDAVAAGTNFLPGDFATEVLDGALDGVLKYLENLPCVPTSLAKCLGSRLEANLGLDVITPLYAWPKGPKLLCQDSGYMQSSWLAPLIARGMTKVLVVKFQGGPAGVLTSLFSFFGLSGVGQNNLVQMIFDGGLECKAIEQDCLKKIRSWADTDLPWVGGGLGISWRELSHGKFPSKFVDAFEGAINSLPNKFWNPDPSKTGGSPKEPLPSDSTDFGGWGENPAGVYGHGTFIKVEGLVTVDNPYFGVDAGKTVDVLFFCPPNGASLDGGGDPVPKPWQKYMEPGAIPVGGGNQWPYLDPLSPFTNQEANAVADLAFWSIVDQERNQPNGYSISGFFGLGKGSMAPAA